ncbi:MAG: drug:proton antiporter [Fibrobacteres bacterium]|nr:drug:proton antiporter [Fibrobacterota bacterium]
MLAANLLILYVEKVSASTAFYTGLLGREPAEASPNFVMYVLDSGLTLGLWAGHDAQPRPKGAGGGAELALTVEDRPAVDALHADWSGKGIPIIQAPVGMDFGYTFVAIDPDGHRLRVFAPGGM